MIELPKDPVDRAMRLWPLFRDVAITGVSLGLVIHEGLTGTVREPTFYALLGTMLAGVPFLNRIDKARPVPPPVPPTAPPPLPQGEASP